VGDPMPQVTYATAYSSTHSMVLTFVCNGQCQATELRGDGTPELGAAAFGTSPVVPTINGTTSTATVTFTNHSFAGTPLSFKMFGDPSWSGAPNNSFEPGSNHTMNDD